MNRYSTAAGAKEEAERKEIRHHIGRMSVVALKSRAAEIGLPRDEIEKAAAGVAEEEGEGARQALVSLITEKMRVPMAKLRETAVGLGVDAKSMDAVVEVDEMEARRLMLGMIAAKERQLATAARQEQEQEEQKDEEGEAPRQEEGSPDRVRGSRVRLNALSSALRFRHNLTGECLGLSGVVQECGQCGADFRPRQRAEEEAGDQGAASQGQTHGHQPIPRDVRRQKTLRGQLLATPN